MKPLLLVLAACISLAAAAQPRTSAEILATAGPSDWRRPAQENLLYVALPVGRVVLELAPGFAPAHVANIRKLVAAGFYGGSSVVRSQDNYVVQWANTADPAPDRGAASSGLSLEVVRPREGLTLTELASRDPYAAGVGLVDGLPVGTDGERVWLAHCYGMVGTARGNDSASGSGDSLYVVIGHAPRHLDRNGTLVGRVLVGMEALSTLPRGSGALGFYEPPEQALPLQSVAFGNAIAESERLDIRVLRTDTALFREFVAARTTRTEDWFADPTGAIGLCNVPVPVRVGPDS